jgi:hypothetical protein
MARQLELKNGLVQAVLCRPVAVNGTPGSGSGTWSNDVAWGEDWTQGSNDPAATTVSGSSGMAALDFANSINSLITGRWRFGSECTVLIIAEVASASTRYMVGNANTGSNIWGIYTTGTSKIAFTFNGFTQTITTTSSHSNNTPFIATFSYSPENSTAYIQINDTSAVTATITSLQGFGLNDTSMIIGGMRSSYLTGKIARVEIYSRALHYRDNTNLQTRISNFKTTLGI